MIELPWASFPVPCIAIVNVLVGLFFEPVLFTSLELAVLGEGTHCVSPTHPPATGGTTIRPLRPLQVPRSGVYH